MRHKALVSWSTGKDSALALYEASKDPSLEIVGVMTTLSSAFGRVSMHGVREELLDAQLDRLGLPCLKVDIPSPCSNAIYEQMMAAALEMARDWGVTHIVFGDLFLEEIRAYREEKLSETGFQPVFPLWGRETRQLAQDMLNLGFGAALTCVDPRKLDRSFAGRNFDAALLASLPPGVDPCGENGEFHTFVTQGPIFSKPIEVLRGEVVERDHFVFADLRPLQSCYRPPSRT
jgi:uncharacterized protein (TIGR00290 family)